MFRISKHSITIDGVQPTVYVTHFLVLINIYIPIYVYKTALKYINYLYIYRTNKTAYEKKTSYMYIYTSESVFFEGSFIQRQFMG